MEKVKVQFGTVVMDGTEKLYCNINLGVNAYDGNITENYVEEQFKLMGKSFWNFIKERESIKNVNIAGIKSASNYEMKKDLTNLY